MIEKTITLGDATLTITAGEITINSIEELDDVIQLLTAIREALRLNLRLMEGGTE